MWCARRRLQASYYRGIRISYFVIFIPSLEPVGLKTHKFFRCARATHYSSTAGFCPVATYLYAYHYCIMLTYCFSKWDFSVLSQIIRGRCRWDVRRWREPLAPSANGRGREDTGPSARHPYRQLHRREYYTTLQQLTNTCLTLYYYYPCTTLVATLGWPQDVRISSD